MMPAVQQTIPPHEVHPNNKEDALALRDEAQAALRTINAKEARDPPLSAYEDTQRSHMISRIGGLDNLIEYFERMERIEAAMAPTEEARIARRGMPPIAAPPDNFAGLSAHSCADACNSAHCVISDAPFCAHPNNGLQSRFQKNPEIVGRFARAQEYVEVSAAKQKASARRAAV